MRTTRNQSTLYLCNLVLLICWLNFLQRSAVFTDFAETCKYYDVWLTKAVNSAAISAARRTRMVVVGLCCCGHDCIDGSNCVADVLTQAAYRGTRLVPSGRLGSWLGRARFAF